MLGYTGKEDVYSVERFSGFADVYNAARPRPPVKTCEIITAMMNGKRVGTVVDLGCGTGLLSQGFTGVRTGVDSAPAMLRRASARGRIDRAHEGDIVSTGLPAGSAPAVIVGNVLRLVVMFVVALFFGGDAALGFFHEGSDLLIFLLLASFLLWAKLRLESGLSGTAVEPS